MVVAWMENSSEPIMLASTGIDRMLIRLPAGANETGMLFLRVNIRDRLCAVRHYDLNPVQVKNDFETILSIIEGIDLFNDTLNDTDPIRFRLHNLDPNIQGQALVSFSRMMNDLNKRMIEKATESRSTLLCFGEEKISLRILRIHRWSLLCYAYSKRSRSSLSTQSK